MNTMRRRNQYAGSCKVCGADVPAGAGWLYSLTYGPKARARRSGSFPKFVKCDRCHGLKAVRKSDLPENRPAPLPTIGVTEIRAGRLEVGVEKRRYSGMLDPVVYLVLADGSRQTVAYQAPITCDTVGCDYDYDGHPVFGGKMLASHAAAQELSRIGWYATDVYETYFLSSLWAGWSDE